MDSMPKFVDVQSLQGISKVIIIPMLTAASVIQCNFSALGIFINQENGLALQIGQFILIFLVHSISVGLVAVSIHYILFLLHIFSHFTVLGILSALFLSFGFLAIYSENAPLIGKLNQMWFYTSFVCGFYFIARASDIDKQLEIPLK